MNYEYLVFILIENILGLTLINKLGYALTQHLFYLVFPLF